MANEKYALLDTDFISKMHLIRKDDPVSYTHLGHLTEKTFNHV